MTLLIAESHTTEAITNTLERFAKILSNYFKEWHIRNNHQKSEARLLTTYKEYSLQISHILRGVRVADEEVD